MIFIKFDGLIFDLDGTLWDSSESVSISWNNILQNNNLTYKITSQSIKKLFGKTNKEIANIVFNGLTESEQKKLITACNEEELNIIINNGGNLFNNVLEILQQLSKKYKLFIVSNCQKGYIESFLTFYNIKELFSDFECEGNTKLSKKDNINLIIKRNNIKNAIYIGDTLTDLKSSIQSNIDFIYASYGFGNINNYKYSLKKFADLPNLINKIEKDKFNEK